MNKNIKFCLAISILCTTSQLWGWGKFSMQRVYAFFGKYTNEDVIEKEYKLEKPGVLTVNNIDGDIAITTEWKRDTVALKAVKKTSKTEDLEVFSIKTNREDQFDGHHLTLSTACSNKAAKGAINYTLLVPAHVTLNLHTERGNIRVQDVNGAVTASTIAGNVELKNVNNTIVAQTDESGTIIVDGAKGNVKATTNKGDIRIADASKSILAHAKRGNIITACNSVPSTSKIVLNSELQGGITLSLPATVNATLQGKTAKGKLTSDHYVTIKPFTTKLNRQTRRDFERQVDGVIGTGEADIRLSSHNGNIKIVETKTS